MAVRDVEMSAVRTLTFVQTRQNRGFHVTLVKGYQRLKCVSERAQSGRVPPAVEICVSALFTSGYGRT